MAPDHAFPLLSALVFLPAAGAMLVAIVARAGDRLGSWLAVLVAGLTVGLAGWNLAIEGGAPSELYAWIAPLGVAFLLESDWLSAVVVAWVALATWLSLVATLPDGRTAVLLLCLQSAAAGFFLAGDVFLVFACLGVATVVVALATSVPRNVLALALAGLVVLIGWFARVHRIVFEQTGFASTELDRWQALVLFPHEQRTLFVVGAVGVALFLPAYAIAIENAPRPLRLALFASAGMMGSYFVLRVLVPLGPRGAESSSSWVVACALALMAWAGLARGWTLLAVGYQGLVLLGLFTFRESAVVGAELAMVAVSVGFFGAVLAARRPLVWFFTVFLVVVPGAAILVPAFAGETPTAVLGTAALAWMAVRAVSLARRVDLSERGRALAVAPVILVSVAIVLGWSTWTAELRPAAATFIGEAPVPTDEN